MAAPQQDNRPEGNPSNAAEAVTRQQTRNAVIGVGTVVVMASIAIFTIVYTAGIKGVWTSAQVEALEKVTIEETDSAVIETRYFKYLNSIREFKESKTENRTYYKDYYYDTKKLREEGVTENGHSVGIWKEYSPDGKLVREINHENRTWRIEDKDMFPFHKLQDRMKLKGDRLIKSVYGESFFNQHVIWSIDGSAIYNKKESGDWTDIFKSKPTKFLLRYHIKFDDDHVYRDMIEFEIDRLGNYIPNQYEQIYGFEKLTDSSKATFQLSYNKAIELAKQNGLIETDTTKATAFLTWEGHKKPEFFNGHYRFYVIQLLKSEKVIGEEKDHFTITNFYNVWSFNPWTGELVEQKQMQQIRAWEGLHGHSTRLMEIRK